MISFNPLSINNTAYISSKEPFTILRTNGKLAIAYVMQRYIWSPIVWKDGLRKRVNFLHADYCALDFDSPEIAMQDVIRMFVDVPHIIGPTRNHRKPKKNQVACDRFRVLLPFERRITDLDEYEYNMGLYIKKYGSDESCNDGARIYWQCQSIASIITEGPESLDVFKCPPKDKFAKHRAHQARLNSIGIMSTFAQKWLSTVIPSGQRNNICFALGCDLARAGLTYEDALSRVLMSPTYKDMVLDDALITEIRRCITNGFEETKAQD